MIIESHAHIGKFVKTEMTEDMIIKSMDKYGIDFTLFSNGSGVEVDHDQVPIPMDEQVSQLDINKIAIDFAKTNPKKLGAYLWIKPRYETCDKDFENLIIENRDVIYGIKVHPYHSKVSFGSSQVQKYIDIAKKYSLVVVTHTATDYESSPKVAFEVAKKNPDVNIVMCHMGLGSDNEEAIDLISKLPNLYGDTAWVKPEKTIKAIEKCGIDKILFGTDNPINGYETYDNKDFYNFYFDGMEKAIGKENYEKFMYKNAMKLFGVSI